MPIDHQDFMHGAALMAIVCHGSFTALNRASTNYGHYTVNHTHRLHVKYADKPAGQSTSYGFTFTPADIRRIADDEQAGHDTWSALVCGDAVICGLTSAELWQVLDPTRTTAQAIYVEVAPGKQLRVRSSKDRIGPIPRNSFPSRMF